LISPLKTRKKEINSRKKIKYLKTVSWNMSWSLTTADQEKYKGLFEGLSPENGKLTGDQVRAG